MSSVDVIGSAIDIETVVGKLMEIERQPVILLEDRVTSMQNKVTAYQALNTRLSALANNVNTMLFGTTSAPFVMPSSFDQRLSSSIFTRRTATSSNDNILTATASGTTSGNGNYSIKVDRLAQAQSWAYTSGPDLKEHIGALEGTISVNGKTVEVKLEDSKAKSVASGTFADRSNETAGAAGKIKLTGGGNSAEIEIGENDTLDDIFSKIQQANVDHNLGINAGIEDVTDGNGATVGYKLAITAQGAGTDNAFSISVENAAVEEGEDAPAVSLSEKLGFVETQSATNAGLTELRDAINKAKAGVTAAIVNDGTNYMLTLTSAETGTANAFSIGGGLSSLAFNPTQQALDAKLTINGIEITSASNSVKGAIEGVVIDLKNVTNNSENVQLNVGVDNDAIVSAVKGIVSAYNEVYAFINNQFAYTEGYQKTLAGDSTLRSMQSSLQSALLTSGVPSGENDGYRSLGQMGLTVANDGSLSLDESKLKAALSDNYDAVAGFFLGYEKQGQSGRVGGMMSSLGEALKGITDPLRSPIKRAMDSLNSNISNTQKSIEDYERRLEVTEDQLYAQFSAADEALRLMRVTQTSIANQLASMMSST